MSSISPRTFTAKSGSPFTIRTAQPEDAAAMIALNQAVGAEAEYLMTQPDEFPQDVAWQRSWTEKRREAPGQLALLAEAAEGLVGSLSFENGLRRRNAHQGMLGMMVRAPWQHQGVGTALLQCLLDWAEAQPLLERVGLGVFAHNRPAIALYTKFGFVEEGRQPRAVKLGPKEYEDVILMYRLV